jgi:hypothetical protein
LEPNSTPSGTITAAAPPGFRQAQEEREEEQLGLLGLDDLQQVLGGVLVVEAAGEGRIGQHQRVLLLLAGVVLRSESR